MSRLAWREALRLGHPHTSQAGSQRRRRRLCPLALQLYGGRPAAQRIKTNFNIDATLGALRAPLPCYMLAEPYSSLAISLSVYGLYSRTCYAVMRCVIPTPLAVSPVSGVCVSGAGSGV